MIRRERYLEQLSAFRNKPIIKVLTGLRRSGKSTLLNLLQEDLLIEGVNPENILYINFDNMDTFALREPMALHAYLREHMKEGLYYYVLIDEIQEAQGWEHVVNSLLSEKNSDIYITGSNSRLLSSELATYIAGRYVEIQVSTLSLAEMIQFRKNYIPEIVLDNKTAFQTYLHSGGFPVVHAGNYQYEEIYRIVKDIYSSAVLRDVVQRLDLRNVDLLERVLLFCFDNIGNTFSARNVAAYFKNQQKKADQSVIYHYLNALSDAFILNRIPRYDIRGKEILKTNEKYYLGDVSLAYAAFGFKDYLIAGVLENFVLQELQRRGYTVRVGKWQDKEIDFVAERANEKVYVQVAYKINDVASTLKREFSPLLEIQDQYPKYVVTLDDFLQENYQGVKHLYLPDFLLSSDY